MFRGNRLVFQLIVFLSLILFFSFQNCGSARRYNNGLSVGTSSLGPQFVPNQIIVKIRAASDFAELSQLCGDNGLVLRDNWTSVNVSNWTWDAPMTVSEVTTFMQGSAMADKFEYIEPNYILTTPGDNFSAGFTLQQVQTTIGSTSNGLTAAPIKINEARAALTPGKARPIVAIIDSGVQLNHDVFVQSNALWRNPNETANGLDDDGNGLIDDINGFDFANGDGNPDDDDGHGTHCAGVVLGVGQDIFRPPLAQAKIQIMALKFLDASGAGSTSNAINAIMYATSKGAKVLSNSWGGAPFSKAMEDVIAAAYNRGAIFVAAAGNETTNVDASPHFPSSYTVPNVVSVAASNDSDVLAGFSNFGSNTVQIAAPGVSILSTFTANQYAKLSGTSMATPFVAGTAALMAYESPNMLSFQMGNILRSSSNSVAVLSNAVINGKRLNAFNAVSAAKTSTAETTQPAFVSRAFASADEGRNSLGGCARIAPISYDDDDWTRPIKAVAYLLILSLWILMLRSRGAAASRQP
jgi:hypothetical protein